MANSSSKEKPDELVPEQVERGIFQKEEGRKTKMVLAYDDSEHSHYALEWTLSHFFSHVNGGGKGFELVIVHAKRLPSSVVNLAGPGAAEVLQLVESDLRKIAMNTVEKAKALCQAHSASATVEIMEGEARTVLIDAVEKHHADILILGSHGYGALRRAFLGSVSDYCAHRTHCSVMIVKKPKMNS